MAAARWAAISLVCTGLAACSTTGEGDAPEAASAHINNETKFSEAEFGVPASERVTASATVPKGGGRAMVGKPYKVRGQWYTPAEDPDYNRSGLASWYGPNFHGRYTANGEIYDQYHLSAAHPTFPLPSYARVTNEENGHSVVVRVNDRGPFSHDRIIDVSSKAAELLDFKTAGVAKVNVQYVGPARLDGLDMPFLMASFTGAGQRGPVTMPPEGQIASGVMVAMNDTDNGVPGVMTDAVPTLAISGAATPAAYQSFDAVDVTVALPDIGPILPERPGMLTEEPPAPGTPSVQSAYAGEGVNEAASAFDAVLADEAKALTEEAIRAWNRRNGAF